MDTFWDTDLPKLVAKTVPRKPMASLPKGIYLLFSQPAARVGKEKAAGRLLFGADMLGQPGP